MSSEPSVTVLTPTYNRPTYLRETIRSVLRQQFADWEMLVINDGGVDVRGIVEGFGDERIRYLPRKQNRGKAACLNLGLEQARGAYIAYLDDDDIWYPNHLSTLVKTLEESPDAGVAYSDLYRVIFIPDEQGKRYPLQKRVEICRDYNRMFMFHFNHTLHVSLMHRKHLALRAGGYDERVRVLIDWNLTRKLSFYTDFVHVPAVTGEYYVPVKDSDRISDVQRRDRESYEQNLRRIRADLPPEPWPMVEKVAVVFPVLDWDGRALRVVRYLADCLDYPCRIILVNRGPAGVQSDCLRALGALSELKNVRVVPAPPGADLHACYLAGAESSEADYYYLPSDQMCLQAQCRLIAGISYLNRAGCDGVRWPEDGAAGSRYDLMLRRDALSGLGSSTGLDVRTIPGGWFPRAFRTDYMLHFAQQCAADGSYATAQRLLDEVAAIERGATGQAYLVQLYASVAFAQGNYERAEPMCTDLISQGYGADNWVRLGQIRQKRGDYAAAARAYRRGLHEIGLRNEDVDSGPFPLACAVELDVFQAMAGLGECLLEIGRHDEAARTVRRASRLCANSHRPYLAFGRLFLKQGDLQRAAEAFGLAREVDPGGKLPAVDAGLARVQERLGQVRQAYDSWLRALSVAPGCLEYAERATELACRLGRVQEAARIYRQFLAYRPGDVSGLLGLAQVCMRMGRAGEAAELAEKAAALSPGSARAQAVLRAARQRAAPAPSASSSPPVKLGN